MTVKELVLLSLENVESFEIDLGTTTKPLENSLYEAIADHEILSYYLTFDKDKNLPLIIIQLKDY